MLNEAAHTRAIAPTFLSGFRAEKKSAGSAVSVYEGCQDAPIMEGEFIY